MAAYRAQKSNNSSSESVENFQINDETLEKCHDKGKAFEINNHKPEILCDSTNTSDIFTSNLQDEIKCEGNINIHNCEINYPKCQFDLNRYEIKDNNVTPNFNVGGLVSTNYHSQPNLNSLVNTQEEQFVKQPNSYSIHTNSKIVEEPHCSHDNISKTNLASFIQDAIGKACNVIQVNPSITENNVHSNVQHNSGGPSTIVVMMNNTTNQVKAYDKDPKEQLSRSSLNYQAQSQTAEKKCLEKRNSLYDNAIQQPYSSVGRIYEDRCENKLSR